MEYSSLQHERTKYRFEMAHKILLAISSKSVRNKIIEIVEDVLKKNKNDRCACEFCDNLAADMHHELSKYH